MKTSGQIQKIQLILFLSPFAATQFANATVTIGSGCGGYFGRGSSNGAPTVSVIGKSTKPASGPRVFTPRELLESSLEPAALAEKIGADEAQTQAFVRYTRSESFYAAAKDGREVKELQYRALKVLAELDNLKGTNYFYETLMKLRDGVWDYAGRATPWSWAKVFILLDRPDSFQLFFNYLGDSGVWKESAPNVINFFEVKNSEAGVAIGVPPQTPLTQVGMVLASDTRFLKPEVSHAMKAYHAFAQAIFDSKHNWAKGTENQTSESLLTILAESRDFLRWGNRAPEADLLNRTIKEVPKWSFVLNTFPKLPFPKEANSFNGANSEYRATLNRLFDLYPTEDQFETAVELKQYMERSIIRTLYLIGYTQPN